MVGQLAAGTEGTAWQCRHTGSAHLCSSPTALSGSLCSLPDPSLLSILFSTPYTAGAVTWYPPFFQPSSTAVSRGSTVKGPNSSQVSVHRLNQRDAWDGFSPLHSVLIILLQKSDAVPKVRADESSQSPTGLRASFQHARGSFFH